MQTIVKEYVVEKTKIGFIRFIFEAYEGLAVVTTLDSATGHIKLTISPEQQDTAFMVIEDLKKDFYFEER
ncbi:MAG: DUF4911 domain-containing protein [Desulfobacterales bacterium]|nr:DUF4911 domain-containing protein [Desulfobacterales bacterium]